MIDAGVPDPELDEILRHPLFSQVSYSKAPKGMEAGFPPGHLFKRWMKGAPQHVGLVQRSARFVLKHKAGISPGDVLP